MLDLSDRGSEFKAPPKVQSSVDKNDTALIEKLPELGKLYRYYKGGLVVPKEIFTIEPTAKPGVSYWSLDLNDKVYSCSCSDFLNKISTSAEGIDQTKYTLVNIPTDTPLISEFCASLIGPKILEEVLQAYNEKFRKYHRAWHIEWIFAQAKKLDLSLSKEQILAILFHNIVYVPGAGTGQNEVMSTLMFKRYLTEMPISLTAEEEQLVCTIIHDTGSKKSSVPESKLIIDLDNLSLADSGLEFCAWEELIWLENKHLMDKLTPKKDFDTRRLKYVLTLAKEPLIFKELKQFEAIARSNIEGLRQAWQLKYKRQ